MVHLEIRERNGQPFGRIRQSYWDKTKRQPRHRLIAYVPKAVLDTDPLLSVLLDNWTTSREVTGRGTIWGLRGTSNYIDKESRVPYYRKIDAIAKAWTEGGAARDKLMKYRAKTTYIVAPGEPPRTAWKSRKPKD